MGEGKRSTTTRMPESERLNPAEVAALHVGPGGRVTIGAPVMTLVAPLGERIVRASRPGRVVPLVATGDRVRPGQALFEIEADATARSGRAVGGRRARRAPGSAEGWRSPVLAVGVYLAACLAVLPALGMIGEGAPAWHRGALIVGAALFAIAAFRLYAPRRRGWARGAVGMVAAGWAGAVGLVALQGAGQERPVPVASAASVALLPTDARALPTPAPLAVPVDVAKSTLRPATPGERVPVHAGSADRLAALGGVLPPAHDVTAPPSSREAPSSRSGERPNPAAADRPLPAPEPLAEVAAAWPLPLWRPAAVASSATALPAAALAIVPAPGSEGAATGSAAPAAEPTGAGDARRSVHAESIVIAAPGTPELALVSADERAPAVIGPTRPDRAQAAATIAPPGETGATAPDAEEGVLAQDATALPPEGGVRVISPSRDEEPVPESASPPVEQEAATAEPAAEPAPAGPVFRAAPGSGMEDRVVRTIRVAPDETLPAADQAEPTVADAPAEPERAVSRFRKPGETHAIPAPK